jgi:hypothetical protein
MCFSGLRLSDAACDALFQTACDCVRDEIKEKKIIHDDVMGVVTTNFDDGLMGSTCGIIFDANIDTPNGSTKVTYIVRTADLETVRRMPMKWTHRSITPSHVNN